jgi:type II secretory pathway pseudopilin PulG
MKVVGSTKQRFSLSRTLCQLASRARRDEGGFTLVEFMVALGILFVALLALVRTATIAFSDVALARQRQTANQLANQLLEEVRALPYETLKKGLLDSDLTADPNIVLCSGEYYYRVCPPTPGAEKIVHQTPLPDVSPLVPHRGQVGPPEYPGTFTWGVYVTEAVNVPSEGAYRVTAIVSWTLNVRQGVRNYVEAQTLIYSPEGCIDTLTHPFGAPCQPYFFVTGGAGGGGLITTGEIDEVSFDSAGIDLLRETSDIQIEQITRVSGSVNLPAAQRTVDGVKSFVGASGSSTADTDPSTPAGAYGSQNILPQAPATLVAGTGENRLATVLGGSDQGSTISTTAAGGANACSSQIDGRACGYDSGSYVGAGSQTLTLSGLGDATLASLTPSGQESTTYVRRMVPVAGQNGLVRGQVTWRLPEIRLGGLPAQVDPPPGWEGYWVRLTGFQAAATAEAGTNSSAPTTSITGGTLNVWTGAGYTSVAVAPAGGAVVVAPVDHTALVGGNVVRVRMSGTVEMEPTTTSEVIGDVATTRTEATARVGSPLVTEFTYRVTVDTVEVADLTLQFNAGRGGVSATYRPAPTP